MSPTTILNDCCDARRISCRIRVVVAWYVLGCIVALVLSVGSIVLGYYSLCHFSHNYLRPLVLLGLGGILLIWELCKSFAQRTPLPHGYQKVSAKEYPALFALVDEVTTALHLSSMNEIYICNDVTAAVFTLPDMKNLFTKPRRYLVMGLGLLSQLDDDELRAVLYHEFGHYSQNSMNDSAYVYRIGQYSKSFIAFRELKKMGMWEKQMKTQCLAFSYFLDFICQKIKMLYSRLSRTMEYEADDVAVRYVGGEVVQRALIHASILRYYYRIMRWGQERLLQQGMAVDNIYEALSLVYRAERPSRKMIGKGILRRIERLGRLGTSPERSESISVQQSVPSSFYSARPADVPLCTAAQFADWMRGGFKTYAKMMDEAHSVTLIVHLAPHLHKLPLCDSIYKILLDGKYMGDGNYKKGYTLVWHISPGKHRLEAFAFSDVVSTPLEFTTEASCTYRIEMNYQRHLLDSAFDISPISIEQIKA